MKQKLPKKNYAFVDGSFNPNTKQYGCGGFLIDQYGKRHVIQGSRSDPEKARMRNVAGELLGAEMAVNLAYGLGMRCLKLFYDYDGIEKWVTGEWNAKKPHTKSYVAMVRRLVKNGLKVTFQHVDGHTGIPGNEEADRLAKEAVGIYKR